MARTPSTVSFATVHGHFSPFMIRSCRSTPQSQQMQSLSSGRYDSHFVTFFWHTSQVMGSRRENATP